MYIEKVEGVTRTRARRWGWKIMERVNTTTTTRALEYDEEDPQEGENTINGSRTRRLWEESRRWKGRAVVIEARRGLIVYRAKRERDGVCYILDSPWKRSEPAFRMRLRLFLVGPPISSYFYNGYQHVSCCGVPGRGGSNRENKQWWPLHTRLFFVILCVLVFFFLEWSKV